LFFFFKCSPSPRIGLYIVGFKSANFQKKIEDRIRNLEQKIDDNVNTGLHHPTHIYTWEEIKNICIRSFAQGVSLYFAYIILGLLYDRILKKQNANTTTTTTTNNNNNNNNK